MTSYRIVEIDDPDDPLIGDLYALCVRIDGPDTRCAPGATFPEVDMMRHAARSGDGLRLWAALDDDDGGPVGMVITGPDGQFQWLKAPTDHLVGVTASAGAHITAALGVPAWGIMRNPDIRRALATHPGIDVDDEAMRVRWNG